ncbi:hypothetical protein V9T40_007851 [Parthenolecanium corni]|uniref:Dystroglycan 1 n=1 Tax=Parthenolecanium corni TaxID=536013 RepID=A0AAN9TY59_9HEMI
MCYAVRVGDLCSSSSDEPREKAEPQKAVKEGKLQLQNCRLLRVWLDEKGVTSAFPFGVYHSVLIHCEPSIRNGVQYGGKTFVNSSRMWNIRIVVLLTALLVKPGFLVDDFEDEEFQASDTARKFWGIQDVPVTVGKLLHSKIPPDAFKGRIVSYDVKGEDEKPLPQWLIFDKESSVLEGVPSENDIGDIQVNVKAFDSRGHFVSDVFVIEVYPLLEKNTNDKRKCKKGEDVKMLVIIIDKHINDFTPIQRIKAIQNLSAYLDIPINTLLLLSTKFINDIEASNMIDFRRDAELSNFNRSVLTWQIGCKEKIWAEKLRDVELVRKYVRNGVLSEVLKLPLVESRSISSANPFRSRRHVAANDTGKVDNKASFDDEEDEDEDETDNEGGDEGGDEELDPDAAPPIPPEYVSSHLNDTIDPSPVTIRPNETAARKGVPPLLETNEQLNDVENETENPNDDEDGDILHRSGLVHNSTPELPAIVSMPNVSSISISPLTPLQGEDVNPSTDSPRYPPMVGEYLPNFVALAGKRSSLIIPENTFHDTEDGNTSNLTLSMRNLYDGTSCPPWIEFDPVKKEVLLLPRINVISSYDFVIKATDSDGMTVNTTLPVAVQYQHETQKVNFEISLHMKPVEDKNLTVTFQLELLDHIAHLYGDENTTHINVRNVTCNPFVLTWTNSSLSSDTCDNTTILNLLNVLIDGDRSTTVSEKARLELSSLVDVEKVTWKGIGLCENLQTPLMTKAQSFKPVVGKVRIDNIMARAGELKVFKIPEGAFYDADVSFNELKIQVWTIDHTSIPNDNWLQYDATNRELYGLPMTGDVGSTKYQVECLDNANVGEGWVARQVIDVVVEPPPKIPYNMEFSVTLKMSFDEFSKSPTLRRLFIEKLAALFGDRDTSSIVISSFISGSVVVTWHNKSLPVDVCLETETEKLRKVLLDDEGNLNENVNKGLGSEFEVKSAQVTPIGICEGGLTEFHSTEESVPSHAIFYPTLLAFVEEYFYEIVLPVIIIVTMLLLASIIACILYRRQRRAKWTLGDDDDRRTYRNKGIPVIFQDELEERLEPTNKTPIIMKEEKPPLPPPEYQKTLPMATTALLSDFDDPSYQQGTVTFTSQADQNGRSKATPIYRKPPPYVPP